MSTQELQTSFDKLVRHYVDGVNHDPFAAQRKTSEDVRWLIQYAWDQQKVITNMAETLLAQANILNKHKADWTIQQITDLQ